MKKYIVMYLTRKAWCVIADRRGLEAGKENDHWGQHTSWFHRAFKETSFFGFISRWKPDNSVFQAVLCNDPGGVLRMMELQKRIGIQRINNNYSSLPKSLNYLDPLCCLVLMLQDAFNRIQLIRQL